MTRSNHWSAGLSSEAGNRMVSEALKMRKSLIAKWKHDNPRPELIDEAFIEKQVMATSRIMGLGFKELCLEWKSLEI